MKRKPPASKLPPMNPSARIFSLILFGVMLSPPDARERSLSRVFSGIVLVGAAIAWGALLLGEPLTLGMALGGALILLGVALANHRGTAAWVARQPRGS